VAVGPTTDEIVTTATNTSGNPRIDRAVLRLNRSASTATVITIQGTPAATPSPPALTQNLGPGGTFDLPLARWTVANGYTSIGAADIINEAWYPQPAGPILCTSTSRPQGVSIKSGQEIRETDTLRDLWWDGTQYRLTGGQILYTKVTNNEAYMVNHAQGAALSFFTTPLFAIASGQAYEIDYWFPVGNGGFINGLIDSELYLSTDGSTYNSYGKAGLTALTAQGTWGTGRRITWKANVNDFNLSVRLLVHVSGGNFDVIASSLNFLHLTVSTTGKLRSEVVGP
jgi:hypothetical protein